MNLRSIPGRFLVTAALITLPAAAFGGTRLAPERENVMGLMKDLGAAANDAAGPCDGRLRELGDKSRASNLTARDFGSGKRLKPFALHLTVASSSERSHPIDAEPRELS